MEYRTYKEQALSTIAHGPNGAALMIQISSDAMAAAIEAGDWAAMEKAQADIIYWAESATFWANSAADHAKRARMWGAA
jgi:hypothetical protein